MFKEGQQLVKGLELKSNVKQLKDMDLFSLDKEGSGETLSCFTTSLKEVLERWGSGTKGKTIGNGLKLH